MYLGRMDAAHRRPFDVFSPACPSRQVFDTIFSRWGILVLSRLTDQPARFSDIRRGVGGISEKMLAQTLRVLEDEGLIVRREWEDAQRVEYALTPAGSSISTRLGGVIQELYGVLAQRQG